jgi:hypothetical protein
VQQRLIFAARWRADSKAGKRVIPRLAKRAEGPHKRLIITQTSCRPFVIAIFVERESRFV